MLAQEINFSEIARIMYKVCVSVLHQYLFFYFGCGYSEIESLAFNNQLIY